MGPVNVGGKKLMHKPSKRRGETDMAWEKVSFCFHLKSNWMNRFDEYELFQVFSRLQSIKVSL